MERSTIFLKFEFGKPNLDTQLNYFFLGESNSMGDLQDPTDGGTVQYVWPYFVGYSLKFRPQK